MQRTIGRGVLIGVLCLMLVFPVQAEAPSWSCHGPYGGRIRCMAISPHFATDQILLAGTETGGLFRSTDGGATWQTVTGLPTGLVIASVVISPHFAQDRTAFVGTSEGGLFRSTDGGSTWALWGEDLPIWTIAQLAISPDYAADQTLLVATNRGLYRSTNGGQRWSAVGPSMNALSVVIAPRSGAECMAFAGSAMGLYLSTDSGRTWTSTMLSGLPVVTLALSPAFGTDQTVLAGTVRGAYLSRTAGGSWEGAWLEEQAIIAALFSPFYSRDRTLLLGTENGLYLSANGGGAWDARGQISDTVRSLIAPSEPAMLALIYAGTDRRGVLRSTDQGTSFSARNQGLTNVPLSAIAVSPHYAVDRTLFAGGPHGVWRSTDDGQSWSLTSLTQAEVRALRCSPAYATDRTVYAATDGGVFLSRDGGQTWEAANSGLGVLDIVDLTFSADQEAWAAAGSGGVYYAPKDATAWVSRSAGLLGRNVTALNWLTQEVTATYLVAGTWGDGILVSGNGGLSWAPATRNPSTPYLRDLAHVTDYAGRLLVFAGTTEGVFRSLDRGQAWDTAGGLKRDTRAIALHPNYAVQPTCYAGTSYDGVYISTNGGVTWHPLNDGLGDLRVHGLAVAATAEEPVLFAATRGSVWRYGRQSTPTQYTLFLSGMFR